MSPRRIRLMSIAVIIVGGILVVTGLGGMIGPGIAGDSSTARHYFYVAGLGFCLGIPGVIAYRYQQPKATTLTDISPDTDIQAFHAYAEQLRESKDNASPQENTPPQSSTPQTPSSRT
ncbi:hypothetical protein E6P97_01875 [Patescibacteria group bacterium]|nr:MAG: hypothetical protein E6P97_01875 [Patescibacteria group bacterium]